MRHDKTQKRRPGTHSGSQGILQRDTGRSSDVYGRGFVIELRGEHHHVGGLGQSSDKSSGVRADATHVVLPGRSLELIRRILTRMCILEGVVNGL